MIDIGKHGFTLLAEQKFQPKAIHRATPCAPCTWT